MFPERGQVQIFYTSLYYRFWLTLPGMARVPEITIFQHHLHYLKKEVWNEVDLLQEEKHQKY